MLAHKYKQFPHSFQKTIFYFLSFLPANPIRPVLTTVNVTAHSVVVQCTQPFSSIIPAKQYSIIIQRSDFPSDNQTASVICAGSSTEFTDLRPFSLYYVMVAAVDGDGNSTGSINFTTPQAGKPSDSRVSHVHSYG